MVQRTNPDQLRDAIDSGRTGDKVANPDPAAAPMHTDQEAGGTPTLPESVARDLDERRAIAEDLPDRAPWRSWAVGVGAVGVMVAAALVAYAITAAI